MLWYICFALTMAILVGMLAVLFQRKLGIMRVFVCMIGSALMAFVLYIPPFFTYHSGLTALLGVFVNVLQMVSLDADPLIYAELVAQATGAGLISDAYNLLMTFVHAALPVMSAMTAVTLIMRCLSMIQVRLLRSSKQDLYIFSQANSRSMILAEDIRRHDHRCKIVFLGSSDGVDYSNQRERIRCQILDETMDNISLRAKNRQVHYYCIHENREENLNQALTILQRLKTEAADAQPNHHIFLFSDDPLVELMVDSLDKGLVELNVINEAGNAAYQLLDRHLLSDAAVDGTISVLLCGFSPVTVECLRAVCWCGQVYNSRLKVRLLGQFPENWAEDFRQTYPGLFTERYDVKLIDCAGQSQLQQALRQHCADAGYIVVAEQQEEETIRMAVQLRRFFYREDPQHKNAPQIYAYIRQEEKAAAVRSLCTAEARADRRQNYNIVPFGMATDIFSFDNITDSTIEKLAKNVHLVYEDIFSDGPIDVPSAMSRYNLFETNKRSNRANAMHIRYKLALLGLALSNDPDAQEVELKDYLDEAMLEKLTYAEHDRWMAFLESEGWIPATLEDVAGYKASGISKGRHNCPLLKMHPYICPFEDLVACSYALGLPDSTVYDRELISRIPDIVHDRWGVTGKKYKIVKKTSGGNGNG